MKTKKVLSIIAIMLCNAIVFGVLYYLLTLIFGNTDALSLTSLIISSCIYSILYTLFTIIWRRRRKK